MLSGRCRLILALSLAKPSVQSSKGQWTNSAIRNGRQSDGSSQYGGPPPGPLDPCPASHPHFNVSRTFCRSFLGLASSSSMAAAISCRIHRPSKYQFIISCFVVHTVCSIPYAYSTSSVRPSISTVVEPNEFFACPTLTRISVSVCCATCRPDGTRYQHAASYADSKARTFLIHSRSLPLAPTSSEASRLAEENTWRRTPKDVTLETSTRASCR